jgi:hypothetical protein
MNITNKINIFTGRDPLLTTKNTTHLYATEKLTTTYKAYKNFNYAVFLHPMPTAVKTNTKK